MRNQNRICARTLNSCNGLHPAVLIDGPHFRALGYLFSARLQGDVQRNSVGRITPTPPSLRPFPRLLFPFNAIIFAFCGQPGPRLTGIHLIDRVSIPKVACAIPVRNASLLLRRALVAPTGRRYDSPGCRPGFQQPTDNKSPIHPVPPAPDGRKVFVYWCLPFSQACSLGYRIAALSGLTNIDHVNFT